MLGIPADDTSSGAEASSYKELVTEIAHLRELLERNVAELAKLNERLNQRDDRISELERLLSESRRSGKRQAAPFSKGDPKEEPAKPGRRSGEAHGRHGHRMAPVGPPDREIDVALPACCPDCGGEVSLERTAEQFQVDLAPMRPVTTKFNLGVGRCNRCGKRVQARTPRSDLGRDRCRLVPGWPERKGVGGVAALRAGLELREDRQPASPPRDQPHRRGAQPSGPVDLDRSRPGAGLDRQGSGERLEMIVPDESGWRVGGEGAWLWAVSSTRGYRLLGGGRSWL